MWARLRLSSVNCKDALTFTAVACRKRHDCEKSASTELMAANFIAHRYFLMRKQFFAPRP